MESQIDLSVEFVSATQNGGTDVNEAISGLSQSGLAQTGDAFMWAIIAAAIIVACGTLAVIMYFRKKRFATSAISSSVKHAASVRGSISSVFGSLFKSTAFVIIASIFAAMLMVAGLSSTFSASAYADGNGGLTPSSNKVIATVNADGSVSFSSIKLTNNTEDVFTLESSIVSIADEAKSVTALNLANFTINGFGGTVFTGNPNGQTYTAENTNKLNPAESTDLTFELTDIDKSSLESLCGKSVFTLSLKGKTAPIFPPLKDALYEYSADDLRIISDYLGCLSDEGCEQDEYYQKFADFRDKGLTDDGSDNGVPMKKSDGTYNDFAKYHWAIDQNGKIVTENGFENNAATTIQARIIGIREDKDESGNPIGLTFMTTHALATPCAYQTNPNTATYAWAGSTEGGQCTLQSFLNQNTANNSPFPQDLIDVVKKAKKGYQYSNNESGEPLGNATTFNKFWAPSMKELYGDCSGVHDGWWPNENEGIQYKSFSENQITHTSYYPFKDIDKLQDGAGGRAIFVWSRSLGMGGDGGACGVIGINNGSPQNYTNITLAYGIVACFCFGTDSSPTPTPEPDPDNWLPMQKTTGGNHTIDFYPAFNNASEVSGYKFAVKGTDEKFTEISNNDITMKKIYEALQPQNGGSKTTTLYYQKTDINADPLKCYTTKDMSWNSAFRISPSSLIPGQLVPYPLKGIENFWFLTYTMSAIYSAQLGINTEKEDYYGKNWDYNDITGATLASNPKINNVSYINFYNSYGEIAGDLLSLNSDKVWGSYAVNDDNAFCYNVEGYSWIIDAERTSDSYSIVLSTEFGGNDDPAPWTDRVQTEPSQQLQTQQTINEPDSDVIANDNTAQKEDLNKPISPYGYTDKNTDIGAQTATGQSTGTATCGQVATDSGGQAQADSGGSASASQLAAPQS